MRQIRPDLWQTSRFNPFPGLNTHAYLLRHESNNGNSLFYGVGNTKEFQAMKELGGISYNFLSHRHEASTMTKQVRDTFKSILVCDSAEASAISRHSKVDRIARLDEGMTTFENGVIGIPSPGHTEGGYSYLYKSPATGENYLFTGDTYYLDNGEFKTFVYTPDGGNPMKFIDTLKELRKHEPDLVISSGYSGEVGFTEMSPEKWRDGIDKNIQILEKM